MKADQFGTASEQLRFKDNWHPAEKIQPEKLLVSRCDNCTHQESGKGKTLQSMRCVRNGYSTKPSAVCDFHSFRPAAAAQSAESPHARRGGLNEWD